ncbi:hypothetical protein GCM10028801_01230 [Nocardioides maradonensis]
MGNHRAEPGKRRASVSVDSTAPSQPYVGRRVANRPVDADPTTGEIPVVTTGLLADPAFVEPVVRRTTSTVSPTPTVEIPLLSKHELMAATGEIPTVGKRRAVAHAGSRKSLFKGLPSAPVLVGAATLVVAIGGAVGTANTGLASQQTAAFAAPNALSGSFGSGTLGGDRMQTVSRDSDRQTLQSATGTDLVNEAERASAQRNSALGVLAKDAEKKAAQIAANRWILPIDAGVYHLTARFGQCSGLWSSCHTGLDFACPTGTPIHAIADGVISSAAWDGSYGNKTVETLDDGTEIWYAHQVAFNVKPGEHVTQGQVIGYVGSTGNTTGPHVHIEVRPGGGDPVDPDPAFVEHGISPDANQ